MVNIGIKIILFFFLVFSSCNDGTNSNTSVSDSPSTKWICPSTPHTNRTLFIFGDSLAAAENGWAEQLALLLQIPKINLAIGGTRLENNNQFSALMCTDIHGDDIVVFQPGINDAYAHGSDLNYLAMHEIMMNSILDRLEQVGTFAVFGSTSKMHLQNPYINNQTILLYADITKKVVLNRNNTKIKFVDVFNNFDPNDVNMADYVHPSTVGYAEIANLYFQAIQTF